MTSLDTIIVKVASRCNLACTYCYEYFAGDTTWKSKPKIIAAQTVTRLGQRIHEYCEDAGISTLNVVMHGGEPLMLGPKRLAAFLTSLRQSAAPAKIRYNLQTNGTLITRDICDVLCAHDVSVGISLDGGAEPNSKRVTLKGEPTLAIVSDKIALLKTHAGHLFRGILSVVDFEVDPIDTLAFLCAYEPPELDLLYPLLTHDQVGENRKAMAAKFGRWMATAMQYWIAHPRFAEIKVRIFEDALQSTISQRPKTDWFGPRGIGYLFVETDGSYDLLDQLKVIGEKSSNYRNLHRSVHNSSIKETIYMARALLESAGGDVLPTDCIGCKWSTVCAGSHLATRHSFRDGFNNRSVYCEGIMDLLNGAHGEMLKYTQSKPELIPPVTASQPASH